MSTAISVALIIPVMNERSKLETLLPTLSRLGVDEVIIVDGGSVDGTMALLQSSNVRYISARCGRARQMNDGARLVGSDVLVFLHADTVFCAGNVARLRNVTGKASVVVGGRFDVRLSGRHRAFRMIEWLINMRSRLSKISTGDQCQFVRRSVFEEMGGFPDQALMEDIEFSKRLKKMGRIACLRDTVITSSRRWERHGIIRTVWLMWKLRFLYWRGISPERLSNMYRDAR